MNADGKNHYPRRVENLLPASKNLGVTRMRRERWQTPRRIRNDAKLLADFQKGVIARGRSRWAENLGALTSAEADAAS
jgi:hypothetical protein